MAHLATQHITPDGLEPAYTPAAALGDTFEPGPTTYIEIINAGVGGMFAIVLGADGNWADSGALAIPVSAGKRRRVGPFPARRFGTAARNLVTIGYSGVTDVTIGVFDL